MVFFSWQEIGRVSLALYLYIAQVHASPILGLRDALGLRWGKAELAHSQGQEPQSNGVGFKILLVFVVFYSH